MSHLTHMSLMNDLGWTLIHFLWQGAIVGVLYGCVVRMMLHRAAPQTRYILALMALCTLILLPPITFFYLSGPDSGPLALMPSARVGFMATGHSMSYAHYAQTPTGELAPLTTWVVFIWLIGVAFMAARAILGWRQVAGLRHRLLNAIDHPWQPLLQKLVKKMHVKGTVQLIASMRARAPMVVGWLKPVILIPPSAVCGLNWRQAEMILAHELAHIRRHDYLVNLLQVMVETLLFYHPVVHWVSRDARVQREFCCDDAVLETCSDRVGYLKALAELENSRLHLSFDMAANGGSLLRRAYRLAHRTEPGQRFHGMAVMLLGLSALVAAAGLVPLHPLKHADQLVDTQRQNSTQSLYTSTMKALAGNPAANIQTRLAATKIPLSVQVAHPWPGPVSIVPISVQDIAFVVAPPSTPQIQHAAGDQSQTHLDIIAAQSLPQPYYPYLTWRDNLGGAVRASFRISETGQVRDINTNMIKGPAALAGAVRAAISAWKFLPVVSNNKIISPRLNLIFNFTADSGQKPDGYCTVLTGSHLCHWYHIGIEDFRVMDPNTAINGVTGLSSETDDSGGNVIIQLVDSARRGQVFCQSGTSGCPALVDTEQHRAQMQHVLDQLRTGFDSGY